MSDYIFKSPIKVPIAKDPKDAVPLQQVEDLISRYHKKECKYATTIELADVTILPKSAIDGYEVAVGDRILVKDQKDQKQNGIYVVKEVATDTTTNVITPAVQEVPASATASYTGTNVTDADVTTTAAALIAKIEETETADTTITITYDGTTDNAWKLADGTVVTLNDYGITINETTNAVADGDTITITYTAKVEAIPAVTEEVTIKGDAKLERAEDMLEKSLALIGTYVVVLQGKDNKDSKFIVLSYDASEPKRPVVVGKDPLQFQAETVAKGGSLKFKKATLVIPEQVSGNEKVSFPISHNFGLLENEINDYFLIIKDENQNDVYISNVPTVGQEADSVTVTFDVPPEEGEKYTVYIVALV